MGSLAIIPPRFHPAYQHVQQLAQYERYEAARSIIVLRVAGGLAASACWLICAVGTLR